MITALPLRENTEIQGDILAGFKKDHMTFLFLQFGAKDAAQNWLAELLPNIATTQQVAAFNEKFHEARKSSQGDDPKNLKATWLGLSLTYPGIQRLTGKETDRDPVFPKVPTGTTIQAFVQGSGSPQRADALGDKGSNAPDKWIFGSETKPAIHAVLTIAADAEHDRDAELNRQREAASRAGVVIVYQQNGATLPGNRRGKEHFGFKDGVSEPVVSNFDDPAEHDSPRMIAAHEFVLGVEDTPLPKNVPDWMKYGSFQVVRRLGQDVPGWWAQVNTELKKLRDAKVVGENAKAEWLGARLVGRWRCGASVAKFPDAPPASGTRPDNDISFRDDPDGVVTPLFSHLRKNAPRDGLIDDGEHVDEKFMDEHRIIRRGIPYGAPFDPANEDGGGPDEPRGLMFVCYQADLVRQFEFIQADWINSPNFPRGRDPQPGPDPMVSGELGKDITGDVAFESNGNGGRKTTMLHFMPFVTTEGSVYAFTPSISTLRGLSRGRLEAVAPGGQSGWTSTLPGGQTRPQEPPAKPAPVDEILPWPDVQGRYWTFSGRTVRAVGAGAAETKALTTGSDDRTGVVLGQEDFAAWPALAGVEQVDAILPVPDEQCMNGESAYWLFHTVNGKQVYRRIAIALDARHTNRRTGDDLPIGYWRSCADIGRIDAVLPVPDMQRVGGKSYYWVFHTTPQGQVYRMIAVHDGRVYSGGRTHPDELVRRDGNLTVWNSLQGISRVEAHAFVPGRSLVDDQTWTWIFHNQQYRLISIAGGDRHTDTRIREDRPNTAWFRRP
ncbi:Dyp-type peroxidase [Streptomyces sp. NPDC005209]|uniref:Dyp-type peroxidase n=1 Tax=Streptomyces sp. NPDC005209 TaxID=3156715 RepID=UPI0033A0AC9D